jgi:alcohol dehydrogenase YqhD (iron-dependent ADH family)
MTFDYYIPTQILFGAGKLNQLAEEKLPGPKALIVISAGTSMRKHGCDGTATERNRRPAARRESGLRSICRNRTAQTS